MATAAGPTVNGKLTFPGPIGTKRRRMRSGGNVSTLTNNTPKEAGMEVEEKTAPTSKCKGATTIPIFLKKTYKMIDTCDPNIASWTEDGDMFVVKDPDLFATQIIPQYFDHNKFSSFARQLNFYGFRKMQSKPIRNSDYDVGTAKHVTFFNENFKRGRCDLLKKIQRSTRGGGGNSGQDQQREVQNLREQVSTLEQKLEDMGTQTEERIRRLELEMLSRLEQMMLAMQQQQQTQLQLQTATSIGSNPSVAATSQQVQGNPAQQTTTWDPSAPSYPRGSSVNSVTFQQQSAANGKSMAPPTLPPHPKQKNLPVNGFPGAMSAPPDRMNSLRGISTLSRGLSGLSRGASIESSTSAVLLRNSWEDKLFSMLMLDEQNGGAAGSDAVAGPTPIVADTAPADATAITTLAMAPVTVSDRSIDIAGTPMPAHNSEDGDMSSVSDSGAP